MKSKKKHKKLKKGTAKPEISKKTRDTHKASGKRRRTSEKSYVFSSEKRKKSVDEFIDEEKLEASNRKKIIISIVLAVVFALALTFYIILNVFQVTTVIVEGNEHYSDDEIAAIVQQGKFGDNSIYLSFKYSNKSVTGIPFVEKMDVEVLDKNTIKVSVYEKAMAGYVEYLGQYMYFDKDGVVVETSNIKTEGIPLVTGLEFDHFTMYEPLPVENDKIFRTVLDVTQLLNKYEIETDKIYFSDSYEMTLYFGKVRVAVGDEEFLEEKIQMLTSILPQLEGKKGFLDMRSYDEGLNNITFTQD